MTSWFEYLKKKENSWGKS